MKHKVEDSPRCEISLRHRYMVDGRYRVENWMLGNYGITDLRSRIEYIGNFLGVHKVFLEYEVVSKRGRRRMAYSEIISVRTLDPDGPTARRLVSAVRAVMEFEKT